MKPARNSPPPGHRLRSPWGRRRARREPEDGSSASRARFHSWAGARSTSNTRSFSTRSCGEGEGVSAPLRGSRIAAPRRRASARPCPRRSARGWRRPGRVPPTPRRSCRGQLRHQGDAGLAGRLLRARRSSISLTWTVERWSARPTAANVAVCPGTSVMAAAFPGSCAAPARRLGGVNLGMDGGKAGPGGAGSSPKLLPEGQPVRHEPGLDDPPGGVAIDGWNSSKAIRPPEGRAPAGMFSGPECGPLADHRLMTRSSNPN